jgi:sugar lactone lactonase YvrE
MAALAGGAAQAAASPHRAGPAVAGDISTVAGGVGGPAAGVKVALGAVCDVAYGAGGVYAGDYASVRRLAPQTGRLTTPAGTGFGGALGSGAPATSAYLSQVCGVTVDRHGNLVIADAGHNLIRVVARHTGRFYRQAMTVGDIYTVAGGGTQVRNGVRALAALLQQPEGVAADPAGNLLIADTGGARIWVVAENTGTFYGQAMTAGHIYTIAGVGTEGSSGDGGPANSAELYYPYHVTLDHSGNVLIADTHNARIRVVAEHTGTSYGQAMTAGHIYTVAGDGAFGSSGDGGPATSAQLANPEGVTVDGSGNLLIADSGSNRVRVVAESDGTFYGQAMTAGDIYTVAGAGSRGQFRGDGGPATSARLHFPTGVTVDGAGNLVIADQDNYRVRVVAESAGMFYGKAMTAGDIYTVAGKGKALFSVYGGPATTAQFRSPQGLAVDASGDLALAASGRVLLVAGGTGTFYGKAMTAGHIYTVAGNGHTGFSGDGGPATQARLYNVEHETLDGAGNLVIGDYGNALIRVVPRSSGVFYGRAMTAGYIYTIAGNGNSGFSGDGGPATSAELQNPDGVTVDAAGNVLIADLLNNRVRVVAEQTGTFYGQSMTAGDIYTIAGSVLGGFAGDGGPAISAELNSPTDVAVDAAGNVLITDQGNYRVRVVAERTGTFYGQSMTAGDIYTIAGDGSIGFSGDGGPATVSALNVPQSVTVDAAGNVLIADQGNQRIRVVAEQAGTFYGQLMTAGDIYTIAGNGTPGFSGNGGPAVNAEISSPYGIAVDGAGDVLIADAGNSQIRKIAG